MSDDRQPISERVRSFWRKPERDVAEELEFHLEMRIEEARKAGMSEEEARAAALQRFGEYREIHGELVEIDSARARRRDRLEWIGDLRRDVIFAWRALRRAPAFASASIATLA